MSDDEYDRWDALAGVQRQPDQAPVAPPPVVPAPRRPPRRWKAFIAVALCLAAAAACFWKGTTWNRLCSLDRKYLQDMPYQAQRLLSQERAIRRMASANMPPEKTSDDANGTEAPLAALRHSQAIFMLRNCLSYANMRAGEAWVPSAENDAPGMPSANDYHDAWKIRGQYVNMEELAILRQQLELALSVAEHDKPVGDEKDPWRSFFDPPTIDTGKYGFAWTTGATILVGVSIAILLISLLDHPSQSSGPK